MRTRTALDLMMWMDKFRCALRTLRATEYEPQHRILIRRNLVFVGLRFANPTYIFVLPGTASRLAVGMACLQAQYPCGSSGIDLRDTDIIKTRRVNQFIKPECRK